MRDIKIIEAEPFLVVLRKIHRDQYGMCLKILHPDAAVRNTQQLCFYSYFMGAQTNDCH